MSPTVKCMSVYEYGYVSGPRWRLRAEDPKVAKLAMHEHLNVREVVPILIHTIDRDKSDQMVYFTSEDDFKTILGMSLDAFRDFFQNDVHEAMKTIKVLKTI